MHNKSGILWAIITVAVQNMLFKEFWIGHIDPKEEVKSFQKGTIQDASTDIVH